ncbi:TetR/AcrR family transcriptional regulator [Pseudomonas chlororaphis]|uniref:TetR/AcrR family transcriptional regulator n=1 Tax=Pseudomonas chlororaphis TaxID=587753 RepID=UPI001B317494|nr:TetR/AcrR family transcriptional regulator [Pseudomonas chlororaphis]MBP5143176.1 TetR/AcrR family transcriptional regulator [Pseudomonas chlororaphis]QTU03138.1 TetR/AcrR family transcriptional regulator [Pseudomonas chlororaphis]
MNSSTSKPAASLGRGRPRSLQKAEAILLAACQNFGRDGYLNARVSNIARDAGVTKVTVYSWYDGKLGFVQGRTATNARWLALPDNCRGRGRLGPRRLYETGGAPTHEPGDVTRGNWSQAYA